MSTTAKKVVRGVKNVEKDDANHPAQALLDGEQEVPTSNIFPADNICEIWLNIFAKMETQDKLTFSRVCSPWHDWTSPLRSQFYFGEIAPKLLEPCPSDSICPFRQLNKTWTQELDQLLVSLPFQLQLETETIFHQGCYMGQTFETNVNNVNEVTRFMEEMDSHPGNPFPSKGITLQFYCEESSKQDYWSSVMLLLNRFGQHVHCLSKCEWIGIELLVNLHKILLQTPNLRKIFLTSATQVGDNDMQEFLVQNCLPRLANLESLQTYNVDVSLIDIILNSCCVPAKMKHLSLDNQLDSRLPEVVDTFSNLEVLISSACTLQDLVRLGNLEEKPPLREIKFGNYNGHFPSSLVYVEVFTALEAFGNTLVSLELKVRIYVPNYANMTFNLPNLKCLIFKNYQGSFDPLLNFKKLSHLDIITSDRLGRNRNDDSKSHLVDILECGERIEESNIWSKMPSLNYFRFETIEYKRQVFKISENGEFEFRVLKV